MHIFENANFNFVRWRWHAIALSWAIVLVGVAVAWSRGGVPMGIDFTGGTVLVVKFEQAVPEDQVRRALDAVSTEKVVQQYGVPADHEVLIRMPQVGQEEGGNLDEGARAVVGALTAANVGKFEVINTEIVGPVIGRDLQLKGIYATLASLVGILLYIWFRFQLNFAVGAIVATFHDIVITLAFLVFFNYDLSLNIVAAILTITGYSVNDTIVIFDRIRENLRSKRRESLEHVVNSSVNQTLSRTVITAGTTLLTVVSLYVFGGEVLEGFAFTMIVGIVTGTYSSMYIASSIAIILGGKQIKGRPQSARKAS
ncbi:MAG: protein translocase subunit SecF [Acidobacteriota bacterium]|nr:protein translocase subunit SecF [Acidobacteriota bacterium]